MAGNFEESYAQYRELFAKMDEIEDINEKKCSSGSSPQFLPGWSFVFEVTAWKPENRGPYECR